MGKTLVAGNKEVEGRGETIWRNNKSTDTSNNIDVYSLVVFVIVLPLGVIVRDVI